MDMNTTVTTTLYGIGGRSERVTGEITGTTRGGSLLVKTANHGTIVVPIPKGES